MIQQRLTNAAVYSAQIKGTAYHPMYLFGSVGVGDVRASIIISAAVAALFSLMWVLLSHSFLQIATATGKVARREYRETRSRQRTLPVVHGALQSCLHELYGRNFGILGVKKPLAAAISPGRAMEHFSGKSQDAAPFDRFAAAVVHRVYGSSLPFAPDADTDASSFCQLLYAAYGTGRSVLWR